MKKFASIIIVITMLLSTYVTAFAYIAGDTDNDFEVTAADARFTLRLAVGLEECNKDSDQFKAADADGDGTVTASDARAILRVSVGLESFPNNTAGYGNIIATKIPYTTNGLTINSLSFDEYGNILLSITNNSKNTSQAVARTSYIPYKLYNATGNVIENGSVYVEKLNPGDSCTKKIYIKGGTAKIIFGAATINFTDLVVVTETTVINGITVSKPPFTTQGIRINSIAIDTEKRQITADITNNTGKAISGYIKFVCYDAKGASLDTVLISTARLNPGEKSRNYSYYPTGTVKIIYSDISVYDSDTFVPISSSTAVLNGVTVTKSPAASKGITVSIQDITDKKVMTLKITNNSSSAIASSSAIEYKEFDANGYVIHTGSTSILDLNKGESCIKSVYLDNNTAKVLLGQVSIVAGTTLTPGATETIDGILTNKMPVNFGGLKISDFSVEKRTSYGVTVSFKITNSTGKPLSSSSYIIAKSLTSDNTVLNSGTVSVPVDLNNGEFCYKSLTIDTDATKLYFFTGKNNEGSNFAASSSYTNLNGIRITSAPYSNSNLTVTSYKINDGRLTLIIKNNTGKTVAGYSYLN
ncbi:MAG: hypothetical protein J1E34_07710, partial [Oscillospiraceae bacterium]|nr:hypothetical protein [Oscillospiraceae bacterium]